MATRCVGSTVGTSSSYSAASTEAGLRDTPTRYTHSGDRYSENLASECKKYLRATMPPALVAADSDQNLLGA